MGMCRKKGVKCSSGELYSTRSVTYESLQFCPWPERIIVGSTRLKIIISASHDSQFLNSQFCKPPSVFLCTTSLHRTWNNASPNAGCNLFSGLIWLPISGGQFNVFLEG